MLHVVTQLRELGLVLSEPRDTTYVFKMMIHFFSFFSQRKKCLKLFGQVLLRRVRLGSSGLDIFFTNFFTLEVVYVFLDYYHSTPASAAISMVGSVHRISKYFQIIFVGKKQFSCFWPLSTPFSKFGSI